MNPAETIAHWVQMTKDVIRRQRLALNTERQYGDWLARYLSFNFQRPAKLAPEQKVERFLTHLARDQDVSAPLNSPGPSNPHSRAPNEPH